MIDFDNDVESEPLLVRITRKYIVPSVFILFVSMVAYYFWVKHNFGSTTSSTSNSPGSAMGDCGLFGDMFGAYSAFFGGLGFIAVAITTVMQMQQAHRSQVETTFFNMLERLTQITNNSYFPDTEDRGQAYLRKAMLALQSTYNHDVLMELGNMARQELPPNATMEQQANFLINKKLPASKYQELVINSYENFYTIHEHNLGHYFRYLYNIIKFIRKSFKDKPQTANEYINLIQAQMSNDELGLLFYNAVSKHGRNLTGEDVFRSWLDEYDFFENIDPRCIFDEAFLVFYPKTHFKFKVRESLANAEA
ncbi:MAG: hypothetical protein FPO08_05710 [Geobacter sp.]|nr:MAG: hypothetical protein FPO08_05710 [Geobacter sp.]